jgi:CRP-like cAMP-binding protein
MPHSSNRSAMDVFLSKLLDHSELNEEEREAIAALPATRVEVPANRDFVRLGETVDHVCLVERGLMGRFGQTQDGKRQFISLHIPGEMPDLRSLMVREAEASLNALTKSTVLRVPHGPLRDLEERYPAIAAAFSRDCVLQGEVVAQWLVNVGRRDSRTRLAHLLCEMALRYGQLTRSPALRYELPMTQEQLGDVLALTPVHVNRTLMALRDDGLVAFSKGVAEIPDWDMLVAVGEFDPAYLHLGNEVA